MKRTSPPAKPAETPDQSVPKTPEGTDFLVILRVAGGLLCALILFWLVFHSILHIF